MQKDRARRWSDWQNRSYVLQLIRHKGAVKKFVIKVQGSEVARKMFY